ncbi:transcriptional corepressor LEUNIG_HOMOLOG-like isoform X2 [Lycium ferocissimum]|uniref:transcriptional corepressor LEUNIG_HOMOLOG-like isoform X2 n=1 Tax=Lycium ferocissimum TaxID=112874 RepID=UPI0028152EBA|nr:transcriptional corepressor LEUNIG_HOMOLOG-like isoform X2 [Lycium ferocissimum]
MKSCGKQSAVQSCKKRKLSSLASVGKEKVTVAKDNTKRGDAGLVSANFLIDALKKRAEQIGISFKEIRDLHTESKLLCCHFNSQGELLATAGHDRKHVTDVHFRPNSMVFATSSFDRTVKIWNAAKPRNPFLNLVGHDEHIMSIDFYPSTAGLLSSCASNGDIRLWDVSRGDYELILSTSVEEDQGLQIHSRSKAAKRKFLRLELVILDYMAKRGLNQMGEVFGREIITNPDPVAINAPERFLLELWNIFYEILSSSFLEVALLAAKSFDKVAQTVENIVPNINPENSTYAPNHTGAKISNVMPVMPSPHLMASSHVMESIGPDLMGEMCGMLPFARNSEHSFIGLLPFLCLC